MVARALSVESKDTIVRWAISQEHGFSPSGFVHWGAKSAPPSLKNTNGTECRPISELNSIKIHADSSVSTTQDLKIHR